MGMLSLWKPTEIYDVPEDYYLVVHPLDDRRESKLDTSQIGPMPMTNSVKLALMALRAYLILMILLVFYHVVDLAGFVSRGH